MKKWILTLLCCLMLSACAEKDENVFLEDSLGDDILPPVVASRTHERPPSPTETPYEGLPTGYVSSKLTGLPIPEESAEKRPIAVVINNLYAALPQSGISQADIIYEVLAEGDITRLVGIFQYFDAEKVGPVRSARDYFIHFAMDYDAVFVHHGGSPSGYSRLKELRIDRLDGMALEGIYYWRDRSYPAWDTVNGGKTRSLEHSSYTSSEKIKAAVENLNLRQDLYEDNAIGYSFNPSVLPLNIGGQTPAADTVQIPFSKSYIRTFTYEPTTGLYEVTNRNGAHRDAETGEALRVSNILIQQVSMRVISGDEAGRRDVKTISSGEGYLITAGNYTSVKWEKTSDKSPTKWTLADGSALRLNPGKTWICVLQDNSTPIFNNGEESE